MVEEVELDDMIDMVDARFEMFARMGTTLGDTVLYRTRIGAGRLVPLQSHIDPECFYVLEGRLEVFLIDDSPSHAGRSLLVTDGIKHAVRNSAETAADLVLATNNRFARFLGRPVASWRQMRLSRRRYPTIFTECFKSQEHTDIGMRLRLKAPPSRADDGARSCGEHPTELSRE